jgi:hypothetical protein
MELEVFPSISIDYICKHIRELDSRCSLLHNPVRVYLVQDYGLASSVHAV